MKLCLWPGAVLHVLLLLAALSVEAEQQGSRERHYYIAAVEIDWNYSGNDTNRRDSTYKKVVFREYEKDFRQAKAHPSWLGLLGPTLRAEVGETIVVTFRNMANGAYSIHPHGVTYGKRSEGANYFDNTSQREKEDDIVQPNREHVYYWEVTQEVSPLPDDPNCLTYTYISHRNVVQDYNSGLIGALLICKPGTLDELGEQAGLHREFVLLFGVFDEKESLFSPNGHSPDDHVKYTINGYTKGALPDISLCAHASVSLHLVGMSSEPEVFSVHMNGQVLTQSGHKVSSVGLISGSCATASLVAPHAGHWLLSSHTFKHREAGMHGFVDVMKCEEFKGPSRRLTILQRRLSKEWKYYIAAEEIVWDYSNSMREKSDEDFKLQNIRHSANCIGEKYKKVVYTLYKNESFTEKSENKQRRTELGILGPVIRAQIRDVITIVFKNLASRPYSIYPHGLTVEKSEEGVNYPEGGNQSHAVQPGETHTYVWKVLEENEPLEADPRCLTRMYHSAVDAPRDISSGLIGPILVCKSESLDVRNVQLRADKEQHAVFSVFDENKSWYLEDNIRHYCDRSKVNKADPDFYKSNVMHTINGYAFKSGPVLGFCNGEVATWHVSSIGAQDSIQTATFYGHPFELNQRTEDFLSLYPMTGETIKITMDNIGVWLLASLNEQEITKGMGVKFQDVECYRDLEYDYPDKDADFGGAFNGWKLPSYDEIKKEDKSKAQPMKPLEIDPMTEMFAEELGLRSLRNQSGNSDVEILDLSFLDYDAVDVPPVKKHTITDLKAKNNETESFSNQSTINHTKPKEVDDQNIAEPYLQNSSISTNTTHAKQNLTQSFTDYSSTVSFHQGVLQSNKSTASTNNTTPVVRPNTNNNSAKDTGIMNSTVLNASGSVVLKDPKILAVVTQPAENQSTMVLEAINKTVQTQDNSELTKILSGNLTSKGKTMETNHAANSNMSLDIFLPDESEEQLLRGDVFFYSGPVSDTSIDPTSSPSNADPTTSPSNADPTTSPSKANPTGHPCNAKPTTSPSNADPTVSPSNADPTVNPSNADPTVSPSNADPTLSPSNADPTVSPSNAKRTTSPSNADPTVSPSNADPTVSPSNADPTVSPSNADPTVSPSNAKPTVSPSNADQTGHPCNADPTVSPSNADPTVSPSNADPTVSPSNADPTVSPSNADPTVSPSNADPTVSPSNAKPTVSPSNADPTVSPSNADPTVSPSNADPTVSPSNAKPTVSPSNADQTGHPCNANPTVSPSNADPTVSPSNADPTVSPSNAKPTTSPSNADPTVSPSNADPTVSPSNAKPTTSPSNADPTVSPSNAKPTTSPSNADPTVSPSNVDPTVSPSNADPTVSPSNADPTVSPSNAKPTTSPSNADPTVSPSNADPTVSPSNADPTVSPSNADPTVSPSNAKPTTSPSNADPTGSLSNANLNKSLSNITIPQNLTSVDDHNTTTNNRNATAVGTNQSLSHQVIEASMKKYTDNKEPQTTPPPIKYKKLNLRKIPNKGEGMKTRRRKEYNPQARSGLPFSPRGFHPGLSPRGARPNVPQPVKNEELLINTPVVIGVPRPDFSDYQLYVPGDEPDHLEIDEQDVTENEYEYVMYKDPYSSQEDFTNLNLEETTKYYSKLSGPEVRTYFIAAEEVKWDYAGYGQRRKEKSELNERESKFTKVVFRGYLDSSFTTLDRRGEMNEHLGILGPIIKAEVGQSIMVVFKNKADRPYSLHPNGVSYTKQFEGLSYEDGSKHWYKYDNEVQPNATYTYIWKTSDMVGPAPNESDCRTWAYYSGVNPARDIHSGLIGPLLVCRKGTLNKTPLNTREFVLLFMTFDESQSWYYERNREVMLRKKLRREKYSKEKLKFHSINGIIYSLKGLRMYTNQLVKWHLINMGSPKDVHSVYFHGQTFTHVKSRSSRQAVFPLLPGSFDTLEMYPSKPGLWQLETEVSLYQKEGMQTLFLVLDNDCCHPLGLESGSVKDDRISASNTRGPWEPHLARLNNQGKYNAWSTEKKGNWIQVDFERPVVISQVATQGAREFFQSQYATNFSISYSNDGQKWFFYKGDSRDFCKTFQGNNDAYGIKKNPFFPPLVGRYIRLHPITWDNAATIRMEFYGCELDGCSVPLGLESGLIEDRRITASSEASSWFNGDWKASLARLNKQGAVNAWRAKQSDMNQWLQVELPNVKKITGIVTQGAKSIGKEMYVMKYALQYSDNGIHWTYYTDIHDLTAKVFDGNTNNDDHVKNYIYPPIFSRFIRIVPKRWWNSITMRVEILGCDFE